MKTSFLAGASIGAIALATGAHAGIGGRPVYQAPASPPWSWSGFYVGGTLGAADESGTVSNDPFAPLPFLAGSATARQTGFIGGVEAGYNAQVSNVVVGIEGDFSWASLNRSATTTSAVSGATDIYSSRLDDLDTFRGRIGWAADRVLFYGTGGVAIANLKDQIIDPLQPIMASPSSRVTGWVAGGGIEYAIMDHWTVKAEYLHVGLPGRTALDSNGSGYAFDFKNTLDIGRVGINYKF